MRTTFTNLLRGKMYVLSVGMAIGNQNNGEKGYILKLPLDPPHSLSTPLTPSRPPSLPLDPPPRADVCWIQPRLSKPLRPQINGRYTVYCTPYCCTVYCSTCK